YIDVSQGINDLDIGRDVWKNFVIGFSGNSQYTWLRSPLNGATCAAYIDTGGGVYGLNVDYNSFGLRPACWVKI
ncbi:MAG: hypothetical protein LBL38_00405, partial [Lactobacillales bacterium]|nr:hypothetical protein [Lactobacillales bacterium]